MTRFLPIILLVLLAACGGEPVVPTAAPGPTDAAPTAEVAQEQAATVTPLPEPTSVVVAEDAATLPPPPTATNQAVAEPTDAPDPTATPADESASADTPTDTETPTIFTDYSDELLGVLLQRPVGWTVQFPVRSEISSYASTAELEADPTQSYGSFRYEAVGRFDDGQPDLPSLLVTYLQQNISAEINPENILPVEISGNPAARWRNEINYSDGNSLVQEEWLIFNAPILFRITTTSQADSDGRSHEADLQKMLQSVRFTEASLLRGTLQFGRYEPYVADNLFYTSANNGIAFRYPPSGFVSDSGGNIDIVSDESLYDGFQEGEAGYAVYYRQLPAGSSAEPSLELADSLISLPVTTARQVDRNTVTIDRYTADAIMFRNRPDNRFTYELAVYVVNQGAGQAAIVSVKFGTAAPAIWNEGVIGSILYGP